jgi:ABC-type phosphate/phosphonate transport system substrate-binding protein
VYDAHHTRYVDEVLVASLPMYDRQELRAHTDALWAFLRDHLRSAGIDDVPDALSRPADHTEVWRDDRLLFTQTCGWDLRHGFADRHRLLGAPLSAAHGCEGPTYASFLMVRRDDDATAVEHLRGRRAAINEPTSFSGRVALELLVGPYAERGRFFSAVRVTGAHEHSAEALAAGDIDVASIDCHTFALMSACRPALAEQLRAIDRGPQTPAPPYVAGPAADARTVDVLHAALAAVATDPSLEQTRRALMLDGVERVDDAHYLHAATLVDHQERRAYHVTNDGLLPPDGRAHPSA